jgi:hypothetical protein
MKGQAIVKETGELFDIKNHWIVKKMTFTIDMPDDMDIDVKEKFEKFSGDFSIKDDNLKEHKDGDYYILSDGNQYMGEELIVGLDNIRDYKISQINNE